MTTLPPTLRRPLRTAANTVIPSRRALRQQWSRIDAAVAPGGGRVQSGPFAGMLLTRATTGSHIPKRLGSYELELHPTVTAMVAKHPRQVIDIGCGEGYYVNGLARLLPEARIIGFDISSEALVQCRAAAELNGVSDRVELRGECSPAELASLLDEPTLVIVDAEGAEAEVLDGPTVPALRHSDLIIELHEFAAPGVTQVLRQSLEPTHTLTLIDQQPRDAGRYPLLRDLKPEDQQRALSESRVLDQQWLIATCTSSV